MINFANAGCCWGVLGLNVSMKIAKRCKWDIAFIF